MKILNNNEVCCVNGGWVALLVTEVIWAYVEINRGFSDGYNK